VKSGGLKIIDKNHVTRFRFAFMAAFVLDVWCSIAIECWWASKVFFVHLMNIISTDISDRRSLC
jgi:hypothetical protein